MRSTGRLSSATLSGKVFHCDRRTTKGPESSETQTLEAASQMGRDLLFNDDFADSIEGIFTTEAQSSQSSEYFLIKNSLLRALRALCASAVQSPSPFTEIALARLATEKPEEPKK